MKFLRAGAIYAAANVASAAVPFALLPVLTRVLGPADYGHVVSFALLVSLCLTVTGLSAHAALGVVWFKRPREEIPAYTGTALAVAAISTLVTAPIVVLALWLAPELGAGITPAWGAVAALTAGANIVLQCRLVLWQSQGRALPSAAFQFAGSIVNAALSLIAVLGFHWGGDGRNGAIALASCMMAIASVGAFARAGEIRWQPSRAQFRTLAVFGVPLIFHSLAAMLLSSADRWFVSARLGAEQLGIYGAGAQLGMVIAVLADAFLKAYNPWLYSRLTSSDPDDKHCAVGAVFAAMPAFLVGAALIGAGLMVASTLLLGPQYRSAITVLPWFVLGGAFTGMYLCTSVLYFFSGRTGLLALVTSSAAACGALSTWGLVVQFGVTGAAAGYALTQGLLALFTTVVAIRSFDLPWGEPRLALQVWARSLFATPIPSSIQGQQAR